MRDGGDTEQKLKLVCLSTYDGDTNGCSLPLWGGGNVFSPLKALEKKRRT